MSSTHTGYYSDLSEFVNTDQILDQVELYRDQAQASQEAAQTAQTGAESAQSAAAASAAAASASEGNSAASASSSSTQASNSMASAAASLASANAASTSAGNAATSASNALASANAAASSAAGVNLPAAAGNALKFLRQNSGATGLEYRTPVQMISDMGLSNSATQSYSTSALVNTLVNRGGGDAGITVGPVNCTNVLASGTGSFSGAVGVASLASTAGITATTIGGTTITASVGLVGPGSGITALNMANAGSGTLSVLRGGTGTAVSTGSGSVVLHTSPTFAGTPASTTAAAGTNTTQIATTAYVRGEVGPAETRLTTLENNRPFSKQYLSSQQTIVAAGALVLAHGLAIVPTMYQLQMICTTADAGFAVGDVLVVGSYDTTTTANIVGAQVSSDGTNITIRTGNLVGIFNKGTGTGVAATLASWRYLVRAWA